MRCTSCQTDLPPDTAFCAKCGHPTGAPVAAQKSSSRKVVLAVLAVVAGIFVLFCAGIAAIAYPNFLNAVDRGKQKRSMADLRSIGTAIEEYSIEHDHYPVASDFDELWLALVPVYAPALPRVDGWGHTFLVASDGESYEILSPGKDGVVDGCGGGAMQEFDADVCFADGEFNQWPEGRQQ